MVVTIPTIWEIYFINVSKWQVHKHRGEIPEEEEEAVIVVGIRIITTTPPPSTTAITIQNRKL